MVLPLFYLISALSQDPSCDSQHCPTQHPSTHGEGGPPEVVSLATCVHRDREIWVGGRVEQCWILSTPSRHPPLFSPPLGAWVWGDYTLLFIHPLHCAINDSLCSQLLLVLYFKFSFLCQRLLVPSVLFERNPCNIRNFTAELSQLELGGFVRSVSTCRQS